MSPAQLDDTTPFEMSQEQLDELLKECFPQAELLPAAPFFEVS
jgi:hypothetical protein